MVTIGRKSDDFVENEGVGIHFQNETSENFKFIIF